MGQEAVGWARPCSAMCVLTSLGFELGGKLLCRDLNIRLLLIGVVVAVVAVLDHVAFL